MSSNNQPHSNGGFGTGSHRQSLDMISINSAELKRLSVARDSVLDASDIAEILNRRRTQDGCRLRKRTNTLLHTHIALIAVCILSSLDAVCVIGQVICDILIMSDKLAEYDDLHEKAEGVLVPLLPQYLNDSDHWTFKEIVERLEDVCRTEVNCDTHAAGSNNHDASHAHFAHLLPFGEGNRLFKRSVGALHHRVRRAAGGDGHEEHDILHELTHSFHIGSMIILSILLAETFLKIFAMWKSFLHHKLEVFDAFVVTVSWCLDVAFWEGIWARPGQEGATLLIFILPWRVIRIVNSFVLVIQEKDLVLLKVAKQRLRSALRKDKESQAKLDKYRLEIRQLQGLCRKCGADESTIQACCPAGIITRYLCPPETGCVGPYQSVRTVQTDLVDTLRKCHNIGFHKGRVLYGKRRRSSLFQSLASLASVAFVSAMGSATDIAAENRVSSSESDSEEGDSPDVRSPVTFSLSPDTAVSTVSGQSNMAFTFDEASLAKYSDTTEFETAYKTKL